MRSQPSHQHWEEDLEDPPEWRNPPPPPGPKDALQLIIEEVIQVVGTQPALPRGGEPCEPLLP
jgi:hypothetical protein